MLNLWTRYYQLAYSYHIQLDSAYNLFLLGENVCYVIDSKLNRQKNIEVPEASFDYPLHHAFGTVKIPILENGILKEEFFLIDPTYKQFFTAVRCNFGRFFAENEDTGKILAPDIGYFMKSDEEKSVCSSIIKNGYILLDDNVAKIYGSGFKLASIQAIHNDSYDLEYDKVLNEDGNYFKNCILNDNGRYCSSINELEDYGFDLEIPISKNIHYQ